VTQNDTYFKTTLLQQKQKAHAIHINETLVRCEVLTNFYNFENCPHSQCNYLHYSRIQGVSDNVLIKTKQHNRITHYVLDESKKGL
jgi:hypothetical protein